VAALTNEFKDFSLISCDLSQV